MRDIDQLPLPARHLLPAGTVVMTDRLAGTDLRMAHVMFSRGCPFPCSFCAAGQTRIQYRGGESARRELEHLIDAYGIEGFAIVDDNFIVSKAKVSDICDHITGLDLRWSALSRVDTIDAPLLARMAASGCIEVKYGMESGSEDLLRAMRKNTRRRADPARGPCHGRRRHRSQGVRHPRVPRREPPDHRRHHQPAGRAGGRPGPGITVQVRAAAWHPGIRQPRRLRDHRNAPAARLGR